MEMIRKWSASISRCICYPIIRLKQLRKITKHLRIPGDAAGFWTVYLLEKRYSWAQGCRKSYKFEGPTSGAQHWIICVGNWPPTHSPPHFVRHPWLNEHIPFDLISIGRPRTRYIAATHATCETDYTKLFTPGVGNLFIGHSLSLSRVAEKMMSWQ
jgi:hypothetical protein